MTADDDFLSRWSRRKRAAEAAEKTQPETKELAAPGTTPSVRQHDDRDKTADAAFDITQLPSIDSITAISDVRDFLRAGVPADLARAALRRAWSADPAIRDFIGLAENAWDFTDPNAMPGFGPLEATDDVRQMVEQIMSRIGDVTAPLSDVAHERRSQSAESAELMPAHSEVPRNAHAAGSDTPVNTTERDAVELPDPQGDRQVDIATQQGDAAARTETTAGIKILRRTHGGALPH